MSCSNPWKLQNKKSPVFNVFNFRMMTIKEQLLQELDQVPESALQEVLEFVRSLKTSHKTELHQSDTWKAYLASKREREEVYRRLASS